MTMSAPMDEVRALVEERGRFEGWLAALDARRAVTPAHVFDRVRVDYDGRLREVLDALDRHAGALRADESALAGRHDAHLRTLGERRDLLAEVELRTLVGEFPAEEGERRRREVGEEVGSMEQTLTGMATQLAEVRTLLQHVARDGGSAGAEPDRVATPEAPPEAAASPAPTPVPSPPRGIDAGAFDDARAALGDPDVRGYSPAHYSPPLGDAGRGTPPFAGQSFAEAAFGTPTAARPGATSTPPGGVTGQQEKTLRCPDCGAMNAPTEWYCEKCGGELAAL